MRRQRELVVPSAANIEANWQAAHSEQNASAVSGAEQWLTMAQSSSTAPCSGFRTLIAVAGGIAAVAAGLCWTVKAVAILVIGHQPPWLFELAPLLMAIAVLALGQQLPRGRPRVVSTATATVALVGALIVLAHHVMPVADLVYGLAMGGAIISILVALVVAGRYLRRRLGADLPLTLGLATIPVILADGFASMVAGEEALELPLAVLGIA